MSHPGTRSYLWITGTDRDRLREQVAAAYHHGASVHSIAIDIGRSYGFTRDLLLEAGIVLHPRGRRRSSASRRP
ncbi:transcriptional regulator [Streptomyces sp. TRM66268-LWL]|uniref:Transcriptional regulator n=1 Tax=Streptomyces polyasparticus TaxID=2767826 RepID=A0ABR7SXU1_9ACTN|nr:helix-turn-helix domain-containing protein [Streptomyces polyasparticus]MBC9719699.1 transcriptional regulator [Streptomyces polyasparticus]